MNAESFSPAWLRALTAPLPEGLASPLETARFELNAFYPADEVPEICFREEMGDSYRIEQTVGRLRLSGGKTGVLYGAYALIFASVCGTSVRLGSSAPYYPLRVLSCWDNMDGSVERGYSGNSLWFEGGHVRYDPARIRQLGRMLAGAGINVLCVNNVNVHYPAQELIASQLNETAALAAELRPFGVRLMLSVDFSMPLSQGVGTADPLDENVQRWWRERAKRIWEAVPDFAGFMVKADSEHRPGPNAYGRTHAEGANMLARAIAPYGGKLIWRAFVYDCMQDWRDTFTDRAKAAFEIYKPLDGRFDDNVILQVKHGPFDFQVREPVSPLLLSMPRTHLALEVQLAQEYTGQQKDIYAMPPLWREVFDAVGKDKVDAFTAVSNLGRDANWTGHPFAALNLFAFGAFGWDPDSDPERVTRLWARLTYGLKPAEEDTLVSWLLRSRSIYEKCTSNLGLGWMVTPNTHYGPNPWGYEFQSWGTYNRADRNAVGVDRTKTGTNYVSQYPEELKRLYEDPRSCPENLLLFFHRLRYDYLMADGRTLIQRLYDDHFDGFMETEEMARALLSLPLPPEDMEQVEARMRLQLENAREWRDVTNTFFHRLSGVEDARGRKIYE